MTCDQCKGLNPSCCSKCNTNFPGPLPFIGAGHAPNDSRCDCEHGECHENGDCGKEAIFIAEIYGITTRLCASCFGYQRRAANE